MAQGPTLVYDAETDDITRRQTNEVARRIKAAFLSIQFGYAGVDLLLKRTPENADKFWYMIAEWVEKAYSDMRHAS